MGPEGHCTSRFKRAMCISWWPHVGVHKGAPGSCGRMWTGGSKTWFFLDVINGRPLIKKFCIKFYWQLINSTSNFLHDILWYYFGSNCLYDTELVVMLNGISRSLKGIHKHFQVLCAWFCFFIFLYKFLFLFSAIQRNKVFILDT